MHQGILVLTLFVQKRVLTKNVKWCDWKSTSPNLSHSKHVQETVVSIWQTNDLNLQYSVADVRLCFQSTSRHITVLLLVSHCLVVLLTVPPLRDYSKFSNHLYMLPYVWIFSKYIYFLVCMYVYLLKIQ